MPSYKLTYFNGRGRAELTRLIFSAAGVPFQDERVTDWPGTAKAEAPLGQLPYLTVDGEKIPQSIAYSRMLAKRFNMAGNDELEQVKTDVVVDTVNDLQNAYYLKVFKATENRDTVISKFLTEDALVNLERIEKLVNLYGSEGFSVGNSLKWSDLHLYDVTSIILTLSEDILNKFPKILAVRRTVESNEKLAAYLKARPETPF
uniref:glutathione transferase n=1 Tax=Brachionus plicatilis TaxID=10195 RepID=A0A3G2JSI2_BRAPC|nr:glutathione S-transferase S12 [Brachionus plicatilis]